MLPDHMHCVITLPPGDEDFLNRIKAVARVRSPASVDDNVVACHSAEHPCGASALRGLIDAVLRSCAQIGIVENFIVVQLLNNKEVESVLPSESRERLRGAHLWNHPDFLHHPSYPGETGALMVRDYQLALIELHNYRIALREAIGDLEHAR